MRARRRRRRQRGTDDDERRHDRCPRVCQHSEKASASAQRRSSEGSAAVAAEAEVEVDEEEEEEDDDPARTGWGGKAAAMRADAADEAGKKSEKVATNAGSTWRRSSRLTSSQQCSNAGQTVAGARVGGWAYAREKEMKSENHIRVEVGRDIGIYKSGWLSTRSSH